MKIFRIRYVLAFALIILSGLSVFGATICELTILVNIQGFKGWPKSAIDNFKRDITANIEDANKILAQYCKDPLLRLGTPQFVEKPEGAGTIKKGDSANNKLVTDGIAEVEKKFGKGKGQKIYFVDAVMDGSTEIGGLASDGNPVAYFPDETLYTRPTQRMDGSYDHSQRVAENGHYILHELLHNAGLKESDHTSNRSIFDARLDDGRRPLKRTVTSSQCKKLEEYFKKRGKKITTSTTPTKKVSLNEYDMDRDTLISNTEFFAMVDDWILGAITNELFFEGIDVWVANASFDETPTPISPPGSSGLPAVLTPMCFVSGIPQSCNDIFMSAPEQSIGFGFRERIELGPGSSLVIEASTFVSGIEIAGGGFHVSLEQNVTHAGDTLIMQGTATRATVLAESHEMAQVVISADTHGTININASFSLADGTSRTSSWSITVTPPVGALGASLGRAVRAQSLFNGRQIRFEVAGSAISEIEVSIYDLNGGQIGRVSNAGSTLVWLAENNGRPLANGLYLYQVETVSAHGLTLNYKPRLIQIMRR